VEMQAREEEIRFLRMQLAEEQRTLSLMKRSLPSKKSIEQEIVDLQIQVVTHHQLCSRPTRRGLSNKEKTKCLASPVQKLRMGSQNLK